MSKKALREDIAVSAGDCIAHIQSHCENAARPKPSRKGRDHD